MPSDERNDGRTYDRPTLAKQSSNGDHKNMTKKNVLEHVLTDINITKIPTLKPRSMCDIVSHVS